MNDKTFITFIEIETYNITQNYVANLIIIFGSALGLKPLDGIKLSNNKNKGHALWQFSKYL